MKLFKVILVNVLGIPLALLFLILSAVSFSDASSGPKGMEIIHGVFRTQSDAVDPTASLTGRGALIIRSARILHYQLESVNDDNSTAYRVETVWDEGDRDSFTLDGKEYRNPPLPGELRRNVYFGTAVLGEESIRLSDAMLYELKRAPQDQVGFIEVCYEVIDPALEGTEFTAAGKMPMDHVIGDESDENILYTRNVSSEELIHDYQKSKRVNGIVFLILGLAAAGIVTVSWIFRD